MPLHVHYDRETSLTIVWMSPYAQWCHGTYIISYLHTLRHLRISACRRPRQQGYNLFWISCFRNIIMSCLWEAQVCFTPMCSCRAIFVPVMVHTSH